MTILFAAVLAALLAVSCASLRVAKSSSSSSFQQDSLIAAYLRSEIQKGLLELRQTVVEFYPPMEVAPAEGLPLGGPTIVVPAVDAGDGVVPEKNDVPPPRIRSPTPGAVKSITRTDLSATREKSVTVDSSSVSGSIARTDEADSAERESEINEPSNASELRDVLRALVAALGMFILLYCIIKFRIHYAKQ